jgi:hypothetical protein
MAHDLLWHERHTQGLKKRLRYFNNIENKPDLLRSSKEREAANSISEGHDTDGDKTAFKTEEDGLFLIGEDSAEAGRKKSEQTSSRSQKNCTVSPPITLSFSTRSKTKPMFRIHSNNNMKVEQHSPNRRIVTPVLLYWSYNHLMNWIRRITRACLARFNNKALSEGACHDANRQYLFVPDAEA